MHGIQLRQKNLYQKRPLSPPFSEEIGGRYWHLCKGQRFHTSSLTLPGSILQTPQGRCCNIVDTGPPQRYASQDCHHLPYKELRFLLGIGKLLRDRIPSFSALANFFIYHRTHNLVYIHQPQDFEFLLHRFNSPMFSAGLLVNPHQRGFEICRIAINCLQNLEIESDREGSQELGQINVSGEGGFFRRFQKIVRL